MDAVAGAVLPAFLFCGCAATHFEVGDSQLNWLQATYAPAGGAACRMNLVGAGYIEYAEGASPLVANDFATDIGNAQWQDRYLERLGVQPSDVRTWIQRFVDAGLAERHIHRPKGGAGKHDVVYVTASIDREKYACITDDARMITVVRNLVQSIKKNGGRP